MSALDELHESQHDDLRFQSDHAQTAFLAEINPEQARRDLDPVTDIESRHLAFLRRTA